MCGFAGKLFWRDHSRFAGGTTLRNAAQLFAILLGERIEKFE